ncbi:MAG: GNAT family N-acetyltransferase [Pseudomonadota bacterium]
MSDIRVRPAQKADRTNWEPLWKGYQEFYNVNLDAETDDLWQRLMQTNPDGPVCLVAEDGDTLLGFTHYLFHGTTWSARKRIYLNDLFTAEQARGRGVGRALIEAVYQAADEAKAESVYWLTQDFNKPGRALYDKVAKLTPFIKYAR